MLNLRRGRYRKPSRESYVDIQAVLSSNSDGEQENWPITCRLVSCDLTPAEWEGNLMCLNGLKPCRAIQLCSAEHREVLGEVCTEDDSIVFEVMPRTAPGVEREWSPKVYQTLREAIQTCSLENIVVRVRSVLTGTFPVTLGSERKSNVSFGDEFLVNVDGIGGRAKEETRWSLVVPSWRIREREDVSTSNEVLDAVLLPLDARLDIRLCSNVQFYLARNLQHQVSGRNEAKAFFLPRFSSDTQTPQCTAALDKRPISRRVFERTRGRLVSVQLSGARSVRPMILATVGKTVAMLPADVRATVMVLEEENADALQDACRALAKHIIDGETSKCLVLDQYNWLTGRRSTSSVSSSSSLEDMSSQRNSSDALHRCSIPDWMVQGRAVRKKQMLPSIHLDSNHGDGHVANRTSAELMRDSTQERQREHSSSPGQQRNCSVPRLTRTAEFDLDDGHHHQTKIEPYSVQMIHPYSSIAYPNVEEAPPLPARKKSVDNFEGRSTPPKLPPKGQALRNSLPLSPRTEIKFDLSQHGSPASLSEVHQSPTLHNGSRKSDGDDCVYVDPNPMPVYQLIEEADAFPRLQHKPSIPSTDYIELVS